MFAAFEYYAMNMILRLFGLGFICAANLSATFTPLLPVSGIKIASNSPPYPGGSYEVGNLLDGRQQTEYSSSSDGTNTFVVFDFNTPTPIAAFWHRDRNDPATVAQSSLTFFDAQGAVCGQFIVRHANMRGGETFFVLPAPVTARAVRWQITGLGPQHYRTVGGAEVLFYAAGTPEERPSREKFSFKFLDISRKDALGLRQPARLILEHPYVETVSATLRMPGREPLPLQLKPGRQQIELELPPVERMLQWPVSLELDGQVIAQTNLTRRPVRQLTVYILPHSHTDIGYTEIQTAIEKKQVNNLLQGIAYARQTSHYPEGSRFVWNVEVLWAADLYLRRLSESQRQDFLEAVKSGQVALCGMYLNELTGLCRPEELLRLFRFSTKLAAQCGVTIDTAMISDVPGYTWGVVQAMNHAGIRYFSTAPNYFDRIGDILVQWENKPFYWVGPDGRSRVLVWIPFWGYAMSHRYNKMSRQLVEDFLNGLESRSYPYEIAYVRWSGHGDNAVPDPSICEFVRDWNAQYAWPRFIISGASEAFREMEQRHGRQLPVVRGDWTPYWEDGAGSSALETALNRHSSDRLVQAETLFAMLNPKAYPVAEFEEAWNHVLLYSEHTWGAWCSISGPERKETLEQWAIKQGYALKADKQSRDLLARVLGPAPAQGKPFRVVNTLSWPRSELVLLPHELSAAGDRVLDGQGKPLPSQRLASGELAFLARDIPPLASRPYTVSYGEPYAQGQAGASGSVLTNELLRIRVDDKTGGIVELSARQLPGNFVDVSGGEALNEYLYLPGDDVAGIQRNGPVKIRVGEKGPLIASLIIESDAPGCKSLRRELRIVAGMDYVEIINDVDKERLQAKSYHAKEGKESVHFAFPFNVPDGNMLLDIPLGMIRPEADQMPSACKNWFTIGRWADVSNKERGITWVTLDAPLVEVGAITANLLNSQYDPKVWRKHVPRTQKLYSWAMNNHWGTNYRAYQEGLTRFRFILRPHRKFDPAEASRFATAFSHPLLTAGDNIAGLTDKPLFEISPAGVLLLSLKPSDDGQALIARLYGASGKTETASIRWRAPAPRAVYLGDTSEMPRSRAGSRITVPGHGVVTLRIEM